ncbi:MAG: DNA polymerase II [Gammaproteobacteria bacterium]
MIELDAFILTRQWRDGRGGLELTYWALSDEGAVKVEFDGERPVCFVERVALDGATGAKTIVETSADERRPLALSTLAGQPVDGLYFRRQADLVSARSALCTHGVRTYEADLKPSDRFLMERFVTAAFTVTGEARRHDTHVAMRNPKVRACEYRPRLRWVALDIETQGLAGRLYCIGVHSTGESRVFMAGDPGPGPAAAEIVPCADERQVLDRFFAWLGEQDPDLILGWNVVGFDLDFLQSRAQALEVGFDAGRGGERAAVLRPQSASGIHVARLPGRVVLDGIELLKAGFWSFENYELETVARELLGRGKRVHSAAGQVAEIDRLYREDPHQLALYNLEDCRLVADIFEHAGLIDFALRRSELTGLALDRLGGSVAAFDNLYLPRLHRRGRVAPDVGDAPEGAASPGGYVLDSTPGLYDNVLLLDFKSLYPSIIRTFRIDPYGLAAPGQDPVPGFEGAAFAREGAILPELIERLWAVRDDAKRARDGALSQAVKILMNSFYCVLGASGCRFHDHRLASSITRRGHEIIRASRDFIQRAGHEVIYGDTDSLFVLAGAVPGGGGATEPALLGARLAADLNRWWRERIAFEHRLESHLEVEFETHFARFLMPTVRGDSAGSKKRYAGLVRSADGRHELVFKGLESVRTDWTPLARRFQRELYRRVFLNEDHAEWVKLTLAGLMAGDFDQELVYSKRLRRPLSEYTGSAPPHVQAARQLRERGEAVSKSVRYVITAAGPRPVTDAIPRPDYQHYRDRQLAPAADGILGFLGTSFDAITDAQLSIF